MMVLTAYLSSGWRVMRHPSNLNIFHWAVMAFSPQPVCACALLEVHSNVNHICLNLCVRMCALVKARARQDTYQPP